VFSCLVPLFLSLRPPPSSTLFPYTTLFRSHNRIIKRTLEAVAVAVGAVVAVPLLAAIVIAIQLDSPGPAFFRQRRIGQDGKVFRSEEHTSELQSRENLVCRLLLEKKNNTRR